MMKGLARLIILGILCVFFTEGVIFTTKPQNPFFALEGSDSSLEWRYTFGNESFGRGVLTFGNTIDIAERFVGDSATWIKPSYKSRLQAKITNNSTSITLSRVKRTDGGTYQLKVVSNPNRARAISQVEISVHYLDQPNIVITESSTPHEGTDVTLSCNVEGKPEPNVSWTMNGFPIDTSENASIYISDDQRRLTIANVQRTGNEEYRCVANNSVGNYTSAASKFDVLYRPKITVHPNTVSKAEGSRIILSCNATGNPEPKISWTKDGFSLNSSRISFSKYHKKLIILNVTKRDSGKYVCIATNDVGEDTSNATLVDIQYIPEIRGHYINVKAEEGRNATLFCNATGNPVPTLSWTKDGSVITRSSKIKLSADQNSYLTVTNVSRTDSGEYLCVAKNSLGNDTSSGIELDVQYRPEITFHPNAVTKPEGSSVILYCNATGNPEPTISWTKIGFSGQLHNNSRISYSEHHKKLTIAKVNMRDSGKYECAATNDVGKDVSSAALVDVTYKPEITTSPHNVTKKEGENVTLTCNATGNPEPTISWTKNGLLLTIKTGISFSPDNKKLKIGNVKREDSGIYQCVANNTLGKDNSTSAEVNVQYQAKISTHPSNITKKEGEDVTLYCNATGNPVPSISWTKDGSPITFNTRTILSKDKNLKITNVHGADRGEYRCVAKNSLGNDTSYPATLKVQFKPEVAIDGDQEQFIAKGENVTLICRYNTSTPASEVQWIKDGEVIAINSTVTKNGSRLTITYYNDSLSQLSIASASSLDSGTYTCKVSNEVNSTVASTSIDVQVTPSIETNPQASRIREGENLTLFCNASGSSLTTSWTKNGSNINSSEDSRIILLADNEQLTITNVSRTDKGAYQCVVSNDVGNATSNAAIVTVQFGPEISQPPSNTTKVEGQTVVFSCVVAGYPTPDVAWTKDEDKLDLAVDKRFSVSSEDRNHNLSITDVQNSDTGQYRCVANNSLGSFISTPASLTVQFAPEFSSSLLNVTVIEGQNVLVNCTVNGNPTSDVKWTKDGIDLSENDRISVSNFTENTSSLTITNIVRGDEGQYRCVANNSVNTTTSSPGKLTVNFKADVEISGSEPKFVEISKAIKLTCQYTALPPVSKVQWVKDGNGIPQNGSAINNGRVNITQSTESQSQLLISSSTRDDEGNYTCFVTNAVGNSSSVTSVIIQVVPNPPKEVKVIAQGSRVVNISWTAGFDGNSDIQNYTVEIRENNQAFKEVVCQGTLSNGACVVSSSPTTASLTGLSPFTKYFIRVFATNTVGTSNSSSVVNATTDEEVPSAAPDFNLTVVNATAVNISWQMLSKEEARGTVLGYFVLYRDLTNRESPKLPWDNITVDGAGTTSYVVANLNEFTPHEFAMQAFNSKGVSVESAVQEIKTDPHKPSGPPQNVTLTVQSSRRILVAWEAVPAQERNGIIKGYKINFQALPDGKTNSTFLNITEGEENGQQITLDKLNEFTNYSIRVLAFTVVGDGPLSDLKVAQTLEDKPTASPSNVTGKSIGSTSISVTWDEVPPSHQNGIITSYNITYHALTENHKNSATVDFPDRQFTLIGLREFVNYSITVFASTKEGDGPTSDPVFVTTDEDKPSAPPMKVAGRSISPTSISVTWDEVPATEQNGIITSYNISYHSLTENHRNSTKVDHPIREVNLTGLREFVNYSITVFASTVKGDGPASVPVFVRTDEDKPSATPVNVTGRSISSTSILVTWDKVPATEQNGIITSYNISYHSLTENHRNSTKVEHPIRVVNLTGLREFVNYSITVFASTVKGDGPASVPVFVRTDEDKPSAPPVNVTEQSISSTSISVTWDEVPPSDQNGFITSYNITYYSLTENHRNSTTVAFPDRQVTLMGLKEFVNYSITVFASTKIGDGPASGPIFVRTAEDKPSTAPNDVKGRNISSTSILVEWGKVSPTDRNGIITSYNIMYHSQTEIRSNSTAVDYPNRQVTLTGLKKFVNYSITVSASTKIGPGPASYPIIVSTGEDKPSAAPVNVKGHNTSSTSILVTWDKVPAADQNGIITSYNITYHSLTEGQRNSTTVNYLSRRVTLTGLKEFVNYSITVFASTVKGDGPKSVPVVVSTGEDKPSASPVNVTGHSTSSTSILVTWGDVPAFEQNGIIRGYNVTYQSLTENHSNSTTLNYSNREVTLMSLREFVNYSITVSTFTKIGLGPASKPIFVTTDEGCPSAPPVNVRGINTSSTSIKVEWGGVLSEDRNGLITRYNITYFSLTEDDSNSTTVDYPDRQVVLKGLREFNYYSITVFASTVKGNGPASKAINVITGEDKPSAPPNDVRGQSTSSTSILVEWNDVPPDEQNGIITSYNITYHSLTENHNGSTTVNYPGRLVTLTGLKEFVNYSIAVFATTDKGNGPKSVTVYVRTDPDEPSASPNSVRGHNTSSTSILVRWDDVPAFDRNGMITSYNITYHSLKENHRNSTKVDHPIHKVNLTGLREFDNYNITVFASTVIGGGPSSEPIVVSTDEDIPSAAPKGLKLIDTTPTSLSVAWDEVPPTDQNGIIVNYTVRYQAVSGEVAVNKTMNSSTREANLTGLIKNMNYSIMVLASTRKGAGMFSTPIFAMTNQSVPTGSPQNLRGNNKSAKSIFVEWDEVPPKEQHGQILNYTIFFKADEGSLVEKPLNSPKRSYVLEDLIEYTKYRIWVSASTIKGAGPKSDFIDVFTDEAVPSKSPDLISVQTVNSTSVKVEWKALSKKFIRGVPTKYTIHYKNSDGKAKTKIVPVQDKDKDEYIEIVSGLAQSTEYSFQVAVSTRKGEGPLSQSESSVTGDPPEPPKVVENNVGKTEVSIPFKPKQKLSNGDPVSKYQVIVMELAEGQDPGKSSGPKYTSVTRKYEERVAGEPYITAEFANNNEKRTSFPVGDGCYDGWCY